VVLTGDRVMRQALPAGAPVDERPARPPDTGILTEITRRLAKLAPPETIPIALEQPSGLLVDSLIAAGLPVVPIHPNVVKACRPRYRAAPGKSDSANRLSFDEKLRYLRQKPPDQVEVLLLGSSTTLHGIDGAILREQLRLGVDVLNLGVQDLRVNQIGFLADVFLAQYPGVAHVIMISTTLDDKACDSVKTRFFAPEDVLGYLNGGSGSSPAAPMRGAGLTPRYASPAPLAPVAAGHRS